MNRHDPGAGALRTVLVVAALLLSACSDESATLTSIEVTPAAPSVALGAAYQFQARERWSDGSTRDVTGTATWTSTDEGVATIAPGGLAALRAAGPTTVRATSGGVSGETSLTVRSDANGVNLPKTGQTVSWAAGDDGSLQRGVGPVPPGPRFTVTYCDSAGACGDPSADCDGDAANDVVTDDLTGLVWARHANLASGARIWEDALSFANALGLCGQIDWRLPNGKELHSLVDYSRHGVPLPPGHPFVDAQPGEYASSTTDGVALSSVLAVNMADGRTQLYRKTATSYAWPVRAGLAPVAAPARLPRSGQAKCYDAQGAELACAGTGQDGEIRAGVAWPSPRFTANSDGTVTDELTGLIWLQRAHCESGSPRQRSWLDALAAAAALKHGDCGLADGSVPGVWRLPNVVELGSLAHVGFNSETCGASPCADHAAWLRSQGFTSLPRNGSYWASTTFGSDATAAAAVFLASGDPAFVAKTEAFYVLPVRAGP